MSRKALVLIPLLFLAIISSSNAVVLVRGQAETHVFRFEGLAVGQCIVAYGGIGPGYPFPMEFSGLGDGFAAVNGQAFDATAFPAIHAGLYISENMRATGAVSLGWKEADGSKHRLAVVVYSTETSEGLFYPKGNQFTLAIGGYSTAEKFLGFKGVYLDGTKTKFVSGAALFSTGIYGPYPWQESILVLLIDVQSGTLFFIGWSRMSTPTPFPPGFLPAAKAYSSIVKEQ